MELKRFYFDLLELEAELKKEATVETEEHDYKQNECTCGAKYTSNPSYHLPYCALNKGKL